MTKESLTVKTSSLPKSRIAIELEIPSSSCKLCINETINTISRTATIPGFRAGKIPKQVLIQRIGITQLHASALEKLIDKSWNEALKIKSIEPLSEPELVDGFEVLLKNFNPEKNLKIILQTDVEPELKLKKTKGIKVEVKKNQFNSNAIEESLEKTRKQFANIVPVNNRPSKMGDIAVVGFEGIYKLTKEKIEGGTSESMDLELEANKMIPGFVEGIVGMKINETKTLELKFPDDYAHEESRGKDAVFTVNLKDLKNRELPALNDEFAKQAGNHKSLKDMKKDIENQLRKNFEDTQKKIRAEALIDALANELDNEIPKAMIDIEVRNNIEQTAQRFAQQGIDIKSTFTPELVKSLAESSRPQAEKNVVRNLALKALSQKEKIKVDQKDIDTKLNEYQEEIKNSPKEIDISRLKEVIRDDLLKVKMISWLEENCEIIEIANKTGNKKTPSKTKTKQKTTKAITSKNNLKPSSKKSIKDKKTK